MNKDIFQNLLKIDRDLIKIDKKLSILKILTPINIEEEKKKFIESEGKYIPKLKYKKLNLNLEAIRDFISNIKIEKTELKGIYKRKKQEILDKINFLDAFLEQNLKKLNKYSQKIYWNVIMGNLIYSTKLLENKKNIIHRNNFIDINDIKSIISDYNKTYSTKLIIEEKDIVSRCIIFEDTLYIKNNSNIDNSEIRSIIAHEFEWHYLRKINWRKQKLKIFSYWTAWYMWLEEWIATYNQDPFIDSSYEKYFFNAERYYFINYIQKHNYEELINELKKYYENDFSKIFDMLVRLKRWLNNISKNYCFTKDLAYVNWYLDLIKFIENWWNIKELYFWKIWLNDLEEIKKAQLVKIDLNKLKIPLFY